MGKIKILISAVLMFSAVFVGWRLIQKSKESQTLAPEILIKPKLANLSSAPDSNATSTNQLANEILLTATENNNNFTKSFLSNASQSLIDGLENGSTSSLDQAYQKIIQGVDVNKLNELYVVNVDQARVKILANTSQQDEIDYLNKLDGLVTEFNGSYQASVNSVLTDDADTLIQSAVINEIMPLLQQEIDALYALASPLKFKDFHIRYIAHEEKTKKFFSYLIDYKKDPLLFLQAVQKMEPVIAETASLRQELANYLEKYNL